MKIAEIPLLGELYVSLLERLYKEHDNILNIDVQPNELVTITDKTCAYDTGNEIQKIIHFDGMVLYKEYDTMFVTKQKYLYIEYSIDENNALRIYCLGGVIKDVSVVDLIVSKKIPQINNGNNGISIVGVNKRIRPAKSNLKVCKIMYEIFGKIQTLLNVYDRAVAIGG